VTRRPFRPVKPRTVGTPKRAISDLVEQAGGIDQVQVRLGVKQSTAYAYADPQSKKEMSFAKVAALTTPETPACAEYLAALAGGVFLPMPRVDTPIGALTAEAIRRQGRAAADLVDALADGRVTQAEAAAALPDLDSALRALALLHSTVAALARSRAD
jgi:hypothetical protein